MSGRGSRTSERPGGRRVADFFFAGWGPLGRTLVAALLTYPILIAVLRISGKRTLAQMNAFDFVVTVALGSTVATILLSNDVGLVQGAEALVLLVLLQFAVTWGSVRWPRFRRLVKNEPRLLLSEGRMIDQALADERLGEDEVLQALREQGVADPASVRAVVLETNGHISVVRRSEGGTGALRNVVGQEDGENPTKR